MTLSCLPADGRAAERQRGKDLAPGVKQRHAQTGYVLQAFAARQPPTLASNKVQGVTQPRLGGERRRLLNQARTLSATCTHSACSLSSTVNQSVSPLTSANARSSRAIISSRRSRERKIWPYSQNRAPGS
ncbi:hypothetical protein SG1523 [Sodalis glossinidius str. 'morsitans']|uniref:Uncharacterized protein n=1 Tax=Sodalis glossinidius (strain morsitans) TaxID=343509 RepID=Q2NSS7_SODGM|nr:hypothetical protein SG1523 [Sodalis glossinidius str. 'morsitans']